MLSLSQIRAFRRTIYGHFEAHGRDLPWRNTDDPYRILVSEFMLQQTQVERVLHKYPVFVQRFRDLETLASAPLRDVLAEWQGLGYNRRAMLLQKTAQRVVKAHNGRLPDSMDALMGLPGIGPATAGALLAFVFHKPSVFVETNIRRVFIHFFFSGASSVADREVSSLVDATLDKSNVRLWYYALMDYGAMLKTMENNPNRRSAHYHKQSAFNNSDRQVRGAILRELLRVESMSEEVLAEIIGKTPSRVRPIVAQLVQEGFLIRSNDCVRISADSAKE